MKTHQIELNWEWLWQKFGFQAKIDTASVVACTSEEVVYDPASQDLPDSTKEQLHLWPVTTDEFPGKKIPRKIQLKIQSNIDMQNT